MLPVIEEYEVLDFRVLTIRERLEIYAKLTKKQRALIDAHRKYLIRSEFLKDSYLKASDWEFLDLKIDSEYPEKKGTQELLYCQCGRRLKYQYIVKSKETGQKMGLGIQHFKDHLNIPHQVATEIVDRLNNVDFALDELLWLKRYNIDFPQALWEHYSYQLYKHQFLSESYPINYSLAQRVIDFKEADMPLYVSDFNEVKREVVEMKKYNLEKVSIYLNKEYFQKFQTSLSTDLKEKSLFNQALIWSNQIQKRLKKYPETPILPNSYFKEIFSILQLETVERRKELDHFSRRGMGKWIQKEVYDHLIIKVEQHGLTSTFLSQIHPFMRSGLYPFMELLELPKKNEEVKIKNNVNKITSLLKDFDQQTQIEIVTKLSEWVGLHK